MNPAKQAIYRLLARLGIEVDGFPAEGLAVGGYWLRPRRERGKSDLAMRGAKALARCLTLEAVDSVLDIGAGAGLQARIFHRHGKAVTCVSLSAPAAPGITALIGDFNTLPIDGAFDLVWASHVLEHQPNVGAFIDRMVSLSRGWVCVTVPVCHRALWGGHLTLWTPGLLAYNLAVAGVDVSEAELIHGWREFSLLFRARRVAPPPLSFDTGDIAALAPVLPGWAREGRDGWATPSG
jgi:SAM-dependent methyltransferase